MPKQTNVLHPRPGQNWGAIGRNQVSAESDDVRAMADKVTAAEVQAANERFAWIRAEMEREAEI
jgi:hypothetical protein